MERRVYRPDGSLSLHEAFRYEADPRSYTIHILDAQGAIVRTRKVLTYSEGEESTVFKASGEICEKTRTRRDSEGRVIEAISEDTVRGEEIRMQVDYRGGHAEAHVTSSQAQERDLHLVAGPDGTSLGYRDSSGRAHELRPARRRIVVQSRDGEGNWTRKTVVEHNPATGDKVVIASTDRTITYYSD